MPRKKKIQIYVHIDPKLAIDAGQTNFGLILKEYYLNDFSESEQKILANTLFSKKRKIFDVSRFIYQGYKFTQFPVIDNNLENIKKILIDYENQLKIFWLQRTDNQYLRYPITKVEKLLHQVLPYDEEIMDIEFDGQTALYFIWRDNQYRITTDLFVKEVQNNLLIDNKITLLIEQLLRQHKANVTY